MEIDVARVPFSRYGAFLAVSYLKATKTHAAGLFLRSVHGDTDARAICQMEALHGDTIVPMTPHATPVLLRLDDPRGTIEMYFTDAKSLRLRGHGIGLMLKFSIGPYATVIAQDEHRIHVNSMLNRAKYMLDFPLGVLAVDAPWVAETCTHITVICQPDGDTGHWSGSIEEFRDDWQGTVNRDSFDAGLRRVERDYAAWLESMPASPPDLIATRELAAYVNWASVVEPVGHLTRPAMYMSKNWMTRLWSWDHCFNALALAAGTPDLAWDQFATPFDHQSANGALPDSVNDGELMWNFCKPPIHGWTLARLLQHEACVTHERLAAIYEPLCRWTDWWFTFRDDDHDGIPQYNHGNDSGWDNATVFGEGMPVESPDLAAFLIVQMDVLADAACRLDRVQEGAAWTERADHLLAALLSHSWRADHFIAPRSGCHTVAPGDCLLPFIALVLGQRLPEEVRSHLVTGLTAPDRFLTPYGLATESVSSPFYESDGYWRGPIWAPSTMLLVDGLARVGEVGWAREISGRFCALAARAGMAENFDALTGAAYRDPAYTWTSSVFLLLAHECLGNHDLHDATPGPGCGASRARQESWVESIPPGVQCSRRIDFDQAKL